LTLASRVTQRQIEEAVDALVDGKDGAASLGYRFDSEITLRWK
jgi:hypothetical protein